MYSVYSVSIVYSVYSVYGVYSVYLSPGNNIETGTLCHRTVLEYSVIYFSTGCGVVGERKGR